MKKKIRKFKIILSNENPFIPLLVGSGMGFSEATMGAESKEQIEKWFKEAKEGNFPSVRRKRLYSIEEIKK